MKLIKLQFKIAALVLFLSNNFLYGALSSQLSPFTGSTAGSIWYDSRTTQMKFNLDYNQYDLLLSQALNNGNPLLSPSISYSNNLAVVQLVTSAGAYNAGQNSSAQLYSAYGIDWGSAQETHAVVSCKFQDGGSFPFFIAGAEIGIFDQQDGVGIAYGRLDNTNASLFRIFTRNNGTTSYFTPNGTAPSDPTKLNLYRIVVTDKATGPIRFDFFNGSTNTWTNIHTITNSQSSLTNVQLRTLHLPLNIACETNITSGGTNNVPGQVLSVATSGFTVLTLGETFETRHRAFSKSISSTVGSTEAHVLTLRNNSTFGAKNNWVTIKIKDFIGYGLNSSIVSGIFKIYKNATVTGTSFTSVDANNSVVSTSTSGTYTPATGSEVYSAAFNAGTGTVLPFNAEDVYILVNPGETLTITSQLPYNSSGNIFTGIRWMEMF